LDLVGDPDAPALRRPDGSAVARFIAGGMTHEAVEREALEDLLSTGSKYGHSAVDRSASYPGAGGHPSGG
jgi:hypothetical protein